MLLLIVLLSSCDRKDIMEGFDRPGASSNPLKPVYSLHLYQTGNDWTDGDVSGEDGELQKGLAWPSPRFVDNGDGTTTDNLTGLMWETSPSATPYDWETTLSNLPAKNTGGYSDWRMPNRNELRSLINYRYGTLSSWFSSQGFSNIQNDYYWTSTTDYFVKSYAFVFHMQYGDGTGRTKTNMSLLWAVRGTSPSVARTGQTDCWSSAPALVSCAATGQDGEHQAGVAWPVNRFTDNGNETITDNLTGLVWARDGNLMASRGDHTAGWDAQDGLQDGMVIWWLNATAPRGPYEALAYIQYLNSIQFGGFNDWRLPNVNELLTLIHYGVSSSAAWLNTQGFVNVLEDSYWVSTTHTMWTNNSYRVYMVSGSCVMAVKTESHYIWPVRGGDW